MKYDEAYYEEKLRCDNVTPHHLKKWVDKLDLLVHVAGNEQKAWSEKMLGHPTMKMPTKAESGYRQVGDYHVYIPKYNTFAGICGERKSVADAYSTFLTGVDRFNREITRFHEDDRFDQFLIMVEGTQEEYLAYQPVFKGSNYNKKVWAKQRTGAQYKAAHKRGTMNGFHARGAHVVFSGNRAQAALDFIDISKKWCKYNYEMILKIDN